MPTLAQLHPQVVHFVIALGLVGIVLRLGSLLGKGSWLNPAAATLIILSAGAGFVAEKSGTAAHGLAERIPGARAAVQSHELWGKRTRNVLLGLAGLEVLGLLVMGKGLAKPIRFLSAAGGLAAGFFIWKVGDLGGDLVYEYAGGVGTRSGDPADVQRLLVAGLFHGARVDRDSGRAEEAARLTEELARQRSDDPMVRFLLIESKLRDRKDPAAALADLAQMQVPPDSARLALRHGLLSSQALVAAGRPDSAKVLLQELSQRFPTNQAIKDALGRLP